MKFITNIKNSVAARREAAGEAGFSLIELVVAVGIMLVLAVGGFIAYSQFTDNARDAAVEQAASSVYTAAFAAYQQDGESAVQPVLDAYDADGISLTTDVATAGEDFTVTATNDDHGNSATAPVVTTPGPGAGE